ncbi:hypothetical protein, partial [Staphylococcus aureus]|uniref:hypothetical protein n=1 Tax=Staphylococcus aureus TaxID=1280 RepID=UPI00202165E2
SLFAPGTQAPIATWSDVDVMQANVQAFFLGAAGLTPTYTDPLGKIQMGFNKAAASDAQIKQLVDMLKKEKTRWHSDRLGRRTAGLAGNSGTNEALTKDPRARAVFHAVCDLMEIAQA